MKIVEKQSINDNYLIKLKSQDWLEKQRIAGKVVANTLSLLENFVKTGSEFNLINLNKLGEEYIQDNECECTFKNYKGFPNGVCISVNKQLVHGIAKDYNLQDGDVVSFDLGATYKGAIADSAITIIYGNPKSDRHVKLIKATEEALMKGISAIKVGNRLGCIGNAIAKHAESYGFGIINGYGGHGICNHDDGSGMPHAPPFVANKSSINEGIRLVPGMTLALEPMFTIGSTKTWVDKDGWTVWCEAEMCTQVEHTVFIHEESVEIITDRANISSSI